MTISISGQVPGKEQNGMYDLEPEWTKERTPEPLVAVVIIERDGIGFKDAKQEWHATQKFTHIEPLTGDSADAARSLLEQAYAKRTGNETLPIPLDMEAKADVVEPALDLDSELADRDAEGE